MFDIAKAAVKGVKEGFEEANIKYKQEELERKRQAAERELEKARAEEAKKREEQVAIIKEKERLAGLSTNEILAEAVMALRGFYTKYEELEDYCKGMCIRIGDLEDDVLELQAKIEELSNNNHKDDNR